MAVDQKLRGKIAAGQLRVRVHGPHDPQRPGTAAAHVIHATGFVPELAQHLAPLGADVVVDSDGGETATAEDVREDARQEHRRCQVVAVPAARLQMPLDALEILGYLEVRVENQPLVRLDVATTELTGERVPIAFHGHHRPYPVLFGDVALVKPVEAVGDTLVGRPAGVLDAVCPCVLIARLRETRINAIRFRKGVELPLRLFE